MFFFSYITIIKIIIKATYDGSASKNNIELEIDEKELMK